MNTSRLMSRTSVAAMAVYAAKDGGSDTSKIGQAENVDTAAPAAGGDTDELGLSAEEQAQFDAMQAGKDPAGTVEHEAEAATGDDGAAAADGDEEEDDTGAVAAADGAAQDGTNADGTPVPAKKPKTISYGRHQRDLQKAQQSIDDLQAKLAGATAETAKEREQRARLDERSRLLLEAIQGKGKAAPAAPAEEPEPDAENDPIGNLQWHNKRLAKQVQDLSSGVQQREQLTAAEAEERQVYGTYEADLQREAAADPTFGDAFVHLRETRYRELGFIYADIDITDPAQCKLLSGEDQTKLSQNIQRAFHNEQMMVARQSLQAGKSPAAVVRNLALARGYKPKAAPAAGDPPPAAPPAKAGNGAAPPARQVAPADAGSVTDQLKAIREGSESSRSLSDAGGSPGGEITPERLAEMTDDEFEAFYNNMPKPRLDRLMGKPATN